MKHSITRSAFALTIAAVTAVACHKSNGAISAPASINIVNAIAKSNSIIPILGTSDAIQYYSSAMTIGYGSGQLYSPSSGPMPLYIVQGTDTSDPKQRIFSGMFDLRAGGIYSFFLAGNAAAPDTLLVQDNIPVHNDSTAGIRIVNLSPGSQAISITLDGNSASSSEFNNIAYRQVTPFKTYMANGSVVGSQYTFVIRDQSSGDSLTSITWNYQLFKNYTLVISGSEDPASSTPIMGFFINNY
jgi:hypothetical protein